MRGAGFKPVGELHSQPFDSAFEASFSSPSPLPSVHMMIQQSTLRALCSEPHDDNAYIDPSDTTPNVFFFFPPPPLLLLTPLASYPLDATYVPGTFIERARFFHPRLQLQSRNAHGPLVAIFFVRFHRTPSGARYFFPPSPHSSSTDLMIGDNTIHD